LTFVVPLFRCPFFVLGCVMVTEYMACDSANIDATTGVCSNPVWVQQPTLFPPLDAGAGIAISIAVLACWALASGFKSMQRAGD
jgi:hypothetical protein